MITHLGTFDLENYGDLLYPIIFRHLLMRLDTTLEVHHYSPLAVKAPQKAGFETYSIQTLFQASNEPRRLVVGGGDILRTDWDVVASHYGTDSCVSYAGLRRSIGPLNAFDYLLRRNIGRLQPAAFHANRFRSRWMNYPAAGPFLFNASKLPEGSLVSYLSCGVPNDFTPIERSRVKGLFEEAHFIYLRDEYSKEKLRRAGVESAIHVAPDLAVTLSDQFEKEEQLHRGQNILSRFGIDKRRSFLCFQCKPHPGFDEEEIVRQLKRYQERTNSAVVLLPTGYCHGDHKFLQSLMRRSRGALKYANVYSIADIMCIIAASDLFVGTSLHGNVTASSFGIPHLFGPLPVDKASGFLRVMNLPMELKLGSWDEMNDKIEFAGELRPEFFSERATVAKEKVYRVINELFQSLLN
jgi:hypothetical protein